MYRHFDVVADAEARAESAALADRLRFRPFVVAAERFAAARGLVIGGSAATRLLLGDPANPAAPPPVALDSFQCDFFSGRALADARALGDALYRVDPDGLGHYVTVRTAILDALMVVSVDGRDLFTVSAIGPHRGVSIADAIVPSLRPAQFAADGAGVPLQLQCAGPEIQLMGVYAALCDPTKAADWGALLAAEASLRAIFRREVREKVAASVAAGPSERRGGAGSSPLFLRLLRDEFAAGPGRVLVGGAAAALLRPSGAPGPDSGAKSGGGEPPRLQVISEGGLDTEAAEVVALAARGGAAIQWAINDPRVPTDPRLRRLTVYLAGGASGHRDRIPVLDVYNTGGHELVPYVPLVVASALGARLWAPSPIWNPNQAPGPWPGRDDARGAGGPNLGPKPGANGGADNVGEAADGSASDGADNVGEAADGAGGGPESGAEGGAGDGADSSTSGPDLESKSGASDGEGGGKSGATLGGGAPDLDSKSGPWLAARREGRRRARADRAPPPVFGSQARGLRLGTAFVLLRFRLVDMWTIQVLLRIGAISAAYAKGVLFGMLADFEAVVAWYEAAVRLAATDVEGADELLFPSAAYVGQFADPDLARKRDAQKRMAGKHFFPAVYLPAARASPQAPG